MPRPPMLEQVDWKAVFAGGLPFTRWIREGEFPEHRSRMKAAIAAIALAPETEAELAALSRIVNVVAIAEDWCGDVVRHVPPLERLARSAPRLKIRYIRRDHPSNVFVRFLTNGGEAIPKFVFLSDKWVECGNWGPMPSEHRRLIARGKAAGDVAAARKRVAALYEADPNCETVIGELMELVRTAVCTRP